MKHHRFGIGNTGEPLTNVNASLTLVWIFLVVPTVLWWKESILGVALMSLWANIASHFAAYVAGRAEQKADRSEEKSEQSAVASGHAADVSPSMRPLGTN